MLHPENDNGTGNMTASENLLLAITAMRSVRDDAALEGHADMAADLNDAIKRVKVAFEQLTGEPAPGRSHASAERQDR